MPPSGKPSEFAFMLTLLPKPPENVAQGKQPTLAQLLQPLGVLHVGLLGARHHRVAKWPAVSVAALGFGRAGFRASAEGGAAGGPGVGELERAGGSE